MTTYFQNPGWPEASRDRIICTLTIELQPDVTQIVLNFILFEVSFAAIGKQRKYLFIKSFDCCPLKLKAPIDGNCVDDQFIVAGQNLNNPLPTICGINSGQHSKSIRMTVQMIWSFSSFRSPIFECSVRGGRQCHGSKSIFIDFNHSGCGAGI